MKDYLISLYIDDEMDLAEKIDFVNEVATNPLLHQETITLLQQEVLLQEIAADSPTAAVFPQHPEQARARKPFSFLFPFIRSRQAGAAVMILVALLAFATGKLSAPIHTQEVTQAVETHRFVLFLPKTQSVKIVGSFTHWQPIPMDPIGNSGYWQLTLRLRRQEHRYSFVTADGQKLTDPTVPLQEKDDFGGANSIIDLSATI